MPNLGDKVRDRITGMTGIVTEKRERLDQPTTYFCEGRNTEKSLLQIDIPVFWLTEGSGRIEVVQEQSYQNMVAAGAKEKSPEREKVQERQQQHAD